MSGGHYTSPQKSNSLQTKHTNQNNLQQKNVNKQTHISFYTHNPKLESTHLTHNWTCQYIFAPKTRQHKIHNTFNQAFHCVYSAARYMQPRVYLSPMCGVAFSLHLPFQNKCRLLRKNTTLCSNLRLRYYLPIAKRIYEVAILKLVYDSINYYIYLYVCICILLATYSVLNSLSFYQIETVVLDTKQMSMFMVSTTLACDKV